MQAIQIKNEIATVIGADHSASTEFLLLRELSHRINNEFTSLIALASLIASRSTSDEVKSALSLCHRSPAQLRGHSPRASNADIQYDD
jgi:two-component sensor histidine kinase